MNEMDRLDEFYSQLRTEFIWIDKLEVWSEEDYRIDGFHNYRISSEIASALITQAVSVNDAEIRKFMYQIEKVFSERNHFLNDLLKEMLTSIIVCDKPYIRERIKLRMGAETRKYYDKMLVGYKEK